MAASSPACIACGAAAAESRCAACGAALRAGGFCVERVLAQTSHSRVYLARGPDGAAIALKELVFAMVPGAQEVDAFHREAALLRELSHPRIPRFVVSFAEGEGAALRLYLAQEYLDGQNLQDRLGEHRFTASEVVAIAREALEILQHLHSLQPPLLHRDVKPANLVLRGDGSLALVDFGAAREVRPGGTHRATLVGTFGYMAPELMGGSADRTADLYGLGATLLHLLSRRPPEDLLWAEPPADLQSALNVGAPLARWLGKLTARRRDERFQSAGEALAALDALAREGATMLVPAPAPRLSVLPRGEAELMLGGRRRRRWEEAPPTLVELQRRMQKARLTWAVLFATALAALAGALGFLH